MAHIGFRIVERAAVTNRIPFVLALAVSLAACLGDLPAGGEQPATGLTDESAQVMRVADSTYRGGDLRSAAALYRRAHELDPSQTEPLLRLGKVFLDLGACRQAAEAYSAAVALDPTDRRAHNGLGVTLDLNGLHAAAQRAFREGLEHAPADPSLRNNLALSQAFVGSYGEAIAILEELAAGDAANPGHRANLALVYGLAGLMDKAAALARRDLDETDVKANLATYARLRELGAQDRATEVFAATPCERPE